MWPFDSLKHLVQHGVALTRAVALGATVSGRGSQKNGSPRRSMNAKAASASAVRLQRPAVKPGPVLRRSPERIEAVATKECQGD